VINSISGENLAFVSVRKATEFIGIHQSYIAKSLIKIFTRGGGRGFLVYKSSTLEEIIKSEPYKEATTTNLNNPYKKYNHTEGYAPQKRTNWST